MLSAPSRVSFGRIYHSFTFNCAYIRSSRAAESQRHKCRESQLENRKQEKESYFGGSKQREATAQNALYYARAGCSGLFQRAFIQLEQETIAWLFCC